jgi:glucose-1-phosphate adenylyltransferase
MRDEGLACFLLAGGEGRRLLPLTKHRAKPSMPFAGNACLLDLTLLNCLRSGVREVYALVQHHYESIVRRVRLNWRAAEERGDMAVFFRPALRSPSGYHGTAEAVWHNLEIVHPSKIRDVLILSGDHVYDMDYRGFLAFHRACEADLTVATTAVPIADASRFGVLRYGGDGRVEEFWEKPPAPATLCSDGARTLPASMGVYAFRAEPLRRALAAALSRRHDADFGRDILPALVARGRVYAFPFADASGALGYWRDVGTLASYYRTQLDAAGPRRKFQLRIPPDFPSSPLRRSFWNPVTGTVCGSSCELEGDAVCSVLAAGAHIARGARVEESVLLENVVVEEGAYVRHALIDRGVTVPAGMVVDGDTHICAAQPGAFTMRNEVTVVCSSMEKRRAEARRRPVTA